MDYQEWLDKASDELKIEFYRDYVRYSDGDSTSEQHFYQNCKYWENRLV